MGLGDLNIRLNNGGCNPCIDLTNIYNEIKELRKLVYAAPPSNGCVPNVNGHQGCVIDLTTTDIPEGINFYYTNARVQAFSDPRYAFKVHFHYLNEIIDFPSQVGHTGDILYTNGIVPYWDAPPNYIPYTDEQAQDAVGNILTNSSSVNFVYNDGANTISATVNGYNPSNWNTAYDKYPVGLGISGTDIKTVLLTLNDGSNLQATFTDISEETTVNSLTLVDAFLVGDADKPQDGDFDYTNAAFDGFSAIDVMVSVDGFELMPSLSDRFSYTLAGTTISFNSELKEDMAIKIWLAGSQGISGPAPTDTIYFGAASTNDPLTESDILAANTTTQFGNGTVNVSWTSFNSTPKYCWFAIPNLGPSYNKTTWFIDGLNNGSIGGPVNLFGDPTIVNVSGQNYYVWITNYETQFSANCQLS